MDVRVTSRDSAATEAHRRQGDQRSHRDTGYVPAPGAYAEGREDLLVPMQQLHGPVATERSPGARGPESLSETAGELLRSGAVLQLLETTEKKSLVAELDKLVPASNPLDSLKGPPKLELQRDLDNSLEGLRVDAETDTMVMLTNAAEQLQALKLEDRAAKRERPVRTTFAFNQESQEWSARTDHWLTHGAHQAKDSPCGEVYVTLFNRTDEEAEQAKENFWGKLGRPDVCELYSPPRVASLASRMKLIGGWSLDLRNGCDLGVWRDQALAEEKLDKDKPYLVVTSSDYSWTSMPRCSHLSSGGKPDVRVRVPQPRERGLLHLRTSMRLSLIHI